MGTSMIKTPTENCNSLGASFTLHIWYSSCKDARRLVSDLTLSFITACNLQLLCHVCTTLLYYSTVCVLLTDALLLPLLSCSTGR
jgi:hypothetical protein